MPFCSEVVDGLGGAMDPIDICVALSSTSCLDAFDSSGSSGSCCEATRGMGGSMGGVDAIGDGVLESDCLLGGGK